MGLGTLALLFLSGRLLPRLPAALGAANIAAALSQSFAISGADSRTAMNDASGGRTQVTGLVAAATIAVVLLFLTEPLRYVPIAALGAVLIKASLSLLDFKTLRRLYRLDRQELALSLLATLGVTWVGAIPAMGQESFALDPRLTLGVHP